MGYEYYINNSLFISVCILRVSPSRTTLGCYAGGALPILYVPMFPWKYFFSTKWERREEMKRELFVCGGGGVLVHMRFWEHPRAHVLECPSLRRMHCTGTSPTTFKCFVSIHHLSCMECWWVLIHSGLGGHLHMVLGPLCSTIRCGSLLIRPFMCDGR